MSSFQINAVGTLANDPEVSILGGIAGAPLKVKFCLVATEAESDHEVITSVWFVAFGALGEAIAKNARKGDQLIVQAQIRANNWTDKEGEKQYDYSFVVQGFRFGAPGKEAA